jgi:hypothetical protein
VLVVTLTPGTQIDQEALIKAAEPVFRVGRWLADQLGNPGWPDRTPHGLA